jgi:hypothetical protein
MKRDICIPAPSAYANILKICFKNPSIIKIESPFPFKVLREEQQE